MNALKKFRAFLAIKSVSFTADRKHKLSGKRYFVIPTNDGKLNVLTSDEILTLREQGVLPERITKSTIYGISYYWTDTSEPHARVRGAMPKYESSRRRSYFYQWFDRHH